MLGNRCTGNRWTSYVCAVSSVPIGLYCVAVALYLFTPVFLNHTSPTVVITSWLFVTGEPIYPDLNSASRYALPYGSMAYVINGSLMKLLGPSFLSAKIGGSLAGLGGIVLAFMAFLTATSRQSAFIHTGILVLFLALFGVFPYSPRPDSFIFFFAALGLFAAVNASKFLAAVIFGVSLGVAFNLKVHSVIYFIPMLVLLYNNHGPYVLLVVFAISLPAAYAPFLHPNISFFNMIDWLQTYSKHGFDVRFLRGSLLYMAFLLAPVVLAAIYFGLTKFGSLRSLVAENRLVIGSFIAAAGLTVVVASKPGAGPHHLIPFIPIIIYGCAYLTDGLQSNTIQPNLAALLVVLVLALPVAYKICKLSIYSFSKINIVNIVSQQSRVYQIVADLDAIRRSNPDQVISMGYGEDRSYADTYLRVLLVFRGNPYFLDAPALMDMQYAGMEIPAANLAHMESGAIGLWLIPKGDEPFRLHNFYDGKPLFDDEFRQIFAKRYELVGPSRFFDLYRHTQVGRPDGNRLPRFPVTPHPKLAWDEK